jgi:hypothetical protein
VVVASFELVLTIMGGSFRGEGIGPDR